jgi:periplasmic mercuric ion binding protein
MKIAKFLVAMILLGFTASVAYSQTTGSANVKTATIKVLGKCDMCKTRIEKTVKAEGATSASWDGKTEMLTVSYDPSKTNVDALEKKLAAVGHDNEKYKATDEAYSKLPGCCHYDRSK